MAEKAGLKNRISSSTAGQAKLPRLGFFVFFFAFVCLYNTIIVKKCSLLEVSVMTYSSHLLTYDMGFLSRILPGQIFHLFFKNPTTKNVTAYETVLLLAAFAAISYFLACFVTAVKEEKGRKIAFVLSMFFLSGPVTVAIFCEEMGFWDSFVFYLALIAFAVLGNRYLRWITPLLFAGMVLTHFGSVFTYMVLCGLLLLYSAVTSEKKSDRAAYTVILLLSCAAGAALLLYFMNHEQENTVLTWQEFEAELTARAQPDVRKALNMPYYRFAFYRQSLIDHYIANGGYYGYTVAPHLEANLPAPLLDLINTVIIYIFGATQTAFAVKINVFQTPFHLVLALPLIAVFYRFWRGMIKCTEKKALRLCYALAMVQFPLAFLLGCLLSTDGVRFTGHAVIVQFAFFLYVLYKERERAMPVFESGISSVDPRLVLCYFLVYASVTTSAYT